MKRIKGLSAALGAAVLATTAASADFVPVNGNITEDTRWTSDNVYILTRIVFVTNGANLEIEPGTIIRGVDNVLSDLALEPGALVVAKGSKIFAQGTIERPIILTSIDDPNVPGGAATIPDAFTNSQGNEKTNGADYGLLGYAPDGDPGDNAFAYQALWGGLIMLGNAYVGANTTPGAQVDDPQNPGTPISNNVADTNADGIPDADAGNAAVVDPAVAGGAFVPIASPDTINKGIGTDFIEGIDPIAVPAAGQLGLYGGLNDGDSSGTVRYVQIRYSGFIIGAANEINSLTTGGLGRNTVIEWVESTFNLDDGYEFFGGTFDTNHLFSHSNQDDSFDGDEGYRGSNQFWVVVQGSLTETRAGYAGSGNGTIVGQVNTDNTYDKLIEYDGSEPNDQGGIPQTDLNVRNFTFISEGGGIRVRNSAQSTWTNGVVEGAGALFQNQQVPPTTAVATNMHYFADGDTGTDNKGNPSGEGTPGATEETTSQVVGKARYTAGGLDLRLAPGAAARTEDGPEDEEDGQAPVRFAGAMRDNNLLEGWTHLSMLGVTPGNNTDRAEPEAALNESNGSKSAIRFDAVAAVSYAVYRSLDNSNWVSAGTVTDGGANDADGDLGSIRFEDNGGPDLAAGQPVYYYVVVL